MTMPLQQLVQARVDELGITSVRELTRRADGRVSYESLRRILNGRHGRLSDDIARGLASTLSLPLRTVRAAADLPAEPQPWQWPTKFDGLDEGERQLVEDVAAKLLAARRK